MEASIESFGFLDVLDLFVCKIYLCGINLFFCNMTSQAPPAGEFRSCRCIFPTAQIKQTLLEKTNMAEKANLMLCIRID